MRILTWNINGIRTIPHYHPWNTKKSHKEILDHLEADIICFQEVKSSRSAISKDVALPDSYDCLLSFPRKKNGYSGVAVYTRNPLVLPLKAEEGLSGLLQPRPPLEPQERISRQSAYPPIICSDTDDEFDFEDLDSEGRTLVVDFGLFVLINVYCPNDGTGSEERDKYKMDFHRILEARVRGLVKEGREVVVVGDLNVCAAVEDHCEGPIMVKRARAEGKEGDEGFWERDVRKWMRDWLQKSDGTGGYMVDIVRRQWPDRRGMFTCWNTKISARESNYGTRIDYILVTSGLLPWIKFADIQPQIHGSDHCPVYLDLHDEIENPTGARRKLSDFMGPSHDRREPPRLATKFWDEYSGRQTSLKAFFGKKSELGQSFQLAQTPPTSGTQSSQPPSGKSLGPVPGSSRQEVPSISRSPPKTDALLSQGESATSVQPNNPTPLVPKRKIAPTITTTSTAKRQKPVKKGQTNISSFFQHPTRTPPQEPTSSSASMPNPESSAPIEIDSDDEELPPPTSSPFLDSPSSSQLLVDSATPVDQKKAWTELLAPIPAPNCLLHGEPAKKFTVNKPGPNKGKTFYVCSRPVGPGYDKGRAERPRDEVDPQWKCDFFKWSSDVRREVMRNGK